MPTNLEALTDRIYQDGVEKAQKEAEEILKKARDEADKIVAAAQGKSEKILKDAEKDADVLKRNVTADLKIAGDQAISRLKQEIKQLLSSKLVEVPVTGLFTDKGFVKDLILAIAKGFDGKRGVELTLPESMQQSIDKAMEASLHKAIDGLQIDFSKKLDAGFRIAKKDEGYSITFTDADFVEFFRPFLNQTTEKVLFNQ